MICCRSRPSRQQNGVTLRCESPQPARVQSGRDRWARRRGSRGLRGPPSHTWLVHAEPSNQRPGDGAQALETLRLQGQSGQKGYALSDLENVVVQTSGALTGSGRLNFLCAQRQPRGDTRGAETEAVLGESAEQLFCAHRCGMFPRRSRIPQGGRNAETGLPSAVTEVSRRLREIQLTSLTGPSVKLHSLGNAVWIGVTWLWTSGQGSVPAWGPSPRAGSSAKASPVGTSAPHGFLGIPVLSQGSNLPHLIPTHLRSRGHVEWSRVPSRERWAGGPAGRQCPSPSGPTLPVGQHGPVWPQSGGQPSWLAQDFLRFSTEGPGPGTLLSPLPARGVGHLTDQRHSWTAACDGPAFRPQVQQLAGPVWGGGGGEGFLFLVQITTATLGL